MVPGQFLAFEDLHRKHREGDHLLPCLQLKQRKGPTVLLVAYFIGWGTLKIYSKNAKTQLMRIILPNPSFCQAVIFLKYKCPFHANDLNRLGSSRR
jgi:hypothetical protein